MCFCQHCLVLGQVLEQFCSTVNSTETQASSSSNHQLPNNAIDVNLNSNTTTQCDEGSHASQMSQGLSGQILCSFPHCFALPKSVLFVYLTHSTNIEFFVLIVIFVYLELKSQLGSKFGNPLKHSILYEHLLKDIPSPRKNSHSRSLPKESAQKRSTNAHHESGIEIDCGHLFLFTRHFFVQKMVHL